MSGLNSATRDAMRRLPLFVVSIAFLAGVAALYGTITARTDSVHVYLLDDPYIHMAVAKNLAQHGVWGPTRYAPGFASSSPLWVLLLAGSYLVVGVRDLIPFAFNVIFGLGIVALLFRETERGVARGWAGAGLSLFQILAIPLIPLVFLGMEHTLHVLLSVAYVVAVTRGIGSRAPAEEGAGPNRSAARWWITALLAASVTATRFESLFLVGCAVLVLLVHHRWRAAIANGCAAVLPVAVNAGYAIAHGGQWLPNSVLLKGNADHPWSIAPTVAKFAAGLHETPQSYVPILVLWITSVILWGALRFLGTRNGDGREDTRAEEAASKETASGAAASGAAASRNSGSRGATGVEASRRTLGSVSRREIEAKLAIFVLTVPLHVHLAELGWFYRYEAYLIAIGTLVVLQGATRLLRELGSHRPGLPGRVGILAASLVLAACLGCPLTTRSIESYRESPLAAQCIYDQPVRLASFLGRYYDGRKVAINDIGAVSYYSDVRSTDLVGLGTNEVARQIEAGTFDFGRYCESEGVEIAIVYPHWYPERPSTWKSAGNWRLARKGPLGGPIINFYGLSEPARTELITHLQEFRDQLPERVAQGGPYIRKLRHQPVRDDDSDVDED